MSVRFVSALAVALTCGVSCAGPMHLPPARADVSADRCPAERSDPRVAGVSEGKRSVATWLARLPAGEADRVLLDGEAIRAVDARFAALADGPKDVLDPATASDKTMAARIVTALGYAKANLRDHKIAVSAGALREAHDRAERLTPTSELRVLRGEATLRCLATPAKIVATGGTGTFDRNRCSEAHEGELVRVLGRTDDGWAYVHAGYAAGWLHGDDPLGPKLSEDEARAYRDARERAATTPFTRRELFSRAFARLGDPYGWAGEGGGVDCSRYTLDLFAASGLALPRNSRTQVEAGTTTVSLAGLDAKARVAKLREAAACGVVLAQMPGHIMIYLGEDGEPGDGSGSFVISALGDIREACPGGGETLVNVDRVDVMPLSVGVRSSKGTLLMRLDHLAVFGACR